MEPEQVEVLKSHFPLWCAQYKMIKGDETNYKPSYPVHTYKHSQQHIYCKGKGGLDKNTECSKNISFTTTGLSFESKYIFRMIDATTFNHLRWEHAVKIVVPRLHQRPNLSATQVKRAARTYTVNTHVHNTAIVCLVALELEDHLNRRVQTETGRNISPAQSVSILDQRESRIIANLEAFKKRKKGKRKKSEV